MTQTVSIPDRLKWILAQLQRLQDNGCIRSEGETDFAMAKNELGDVIATYTAPMAPAPDIVNQVFQPGELDALAGTIAANVTAQVRTELEQSDVAVMAAITETRAELLAAAKAA